MNIRTHTHSNIRQIAKNTQMTDLSTFRYDTPRATAVTHYGDNFTRSQPRDNAGWKIAGMSVAMMSIPLAIGAKSPALALVGGLVGLGLAFGSDR